MKNKKQNILRIVLISVMIIGILVTIFLGLNLGNEYGQSSYLEISLGKDFNSNDVKSICEEVLGQKVTVQKIEIFETSVIVKAKNIDEEKIEELLNKINEKYETEITKDGISIGEIPNYSAIDIAKPYVVPVLISAVLIVAYIGVRYRKNDVIKLILEYVGELVITFVLLLSAYAIFRIPVNHFAMPIAICAMICYTMLALKKMEELR